MSEALTFRSAAELMAVSCTSARFADSRVVQQREDALFLGLGTGKNHLAQAIDRAAIQQGYRVAAISAHSPLRCPAALIGRRR